MSEPAVGYRFKVEIEGKDLGVFTKLDGLGARYDMLTIKEGGENGFVHKLPGRVEYDEIKLTRPVDDKSGEIAAWFSGYQNAIRQGQRLEMTTASISAFDGDDLVVATRSLLGVFPTRYSGPSFEAGSSSVLSETLELSHQGFWTQVPSFAFGLSIGLDGITIKGRTPLGSASLSTGSLTGGSPGGSASAPALGAGSLGF